MSPVAEPPPAVWQAPVAPAEVVRAFHQVSPFAAGGHRGIDLRARPGQSVRSPCSGRVVFRGAVAGGPPTLTLRCGPLRATLQRVAPAVGPGRSVGRGAVVGLATAGALDLSARRADGSYLDPARLLGVREGAASPPVVAARRLGRPPTAARPSAPEHGARPGASASAAQHPARLADRALVTSSAARPAPGPRASVDVPLGVAGSVLSAAAVAVLAGTALRRRRRGPGRAAHAMPARLQR